MKKWLVLLLWAVLLFPGPVWAGKEKLYIYNWTEYLPQEIIQQFEEETGIRVVYSTYESNEAMYAKVRLMRGRGYDLIFPSTYFVHKMRNQGLLAKIDHSRLPNFKHLDTGLLDKPYDPGNLYSIPYIWGSTGLIFNKDQIKSSSMTSWKDLWRPEFRNRLVMNDDLREVLGVGLIVNGYSINDTDSSHIEQAYESIRKLLPNILVFSGDSPKQPMLNLETWAGMSWNGEAYMANQENPAISYAYPKEGAIFWMDSMAIPKKARNIHAAHEFINFILKPEIAVRICEHLGYSPPNVTAKKMIKSSFADNPMIFPHEAHVEKGEFQMDVGDAILVYERFWERLKTGS